MVAKAKEEKLEMASHVQELKKGPWKPEEDLLLIDYVKKHGERDWNMVRKYSGLNRCGKSCRLRWNNHLRPNLRKGPFTPEEQKLIFELHSQIGNKWARIAAMLPGRTDNEIKNFWNTRIKKFARKGTPFYPADIHSPRPDYLAGQSNPSSSPPLTSSASTFQTQPSPTTPTSNSILFPPPHSPTQPQQIHHYDAVLQSSMALYDAALQNSRQQNQQPMFTTSNNASAFQRFKRHRSVPNLTISVPTVRHVTLHPFSPLGFSTTSSPLGQSVSIASSPITSSYMHLTPSPHSYTSSPTGMMISPTALQLGIPASQPSPPVVNCRPTSLPRTTSFSFNNMLFDLNPNTTSFPHVQQHTQYSLDAIDNELAFSVEDLGISMEHDTCQILPHNQSSNHISDPQPTVNNVDDFLRQEAEFSAEQATAFLTELENDLEESKLNRSTSNRAEAGFDCNLESMQELELVHDDELSNLLCSTDLPQSFWENENGGVSQPQAVPSYQFIDDHVLGMEMHQLGSSVPVGASSSWDNIPGIY